MGDTVGMAEARNHLSRLVNRAASGGERIVLRSRGKPKAAIISMADLQRLEELEREQGQTQQEQYAVLERAAALRQRMAEDRGGRHLPDSVEDLREMRAQRSER